MSEVVRIGFLSSGDITIFYKSYNNDYLPNFVWYVLERPVKGILML